MSDKKKNIWAEDELQMEMKKKQVASVRNKVYIFCFWVIIFMFRPTFLSPIENVRGEEAFSIKILDPINSMFHGRWEWWILSEIEALDIEIEELKKTIETINIEKEVVSHLLNEKKQNTILNCLNYELCDDIAQPLLDQLDFLRIFIIIGQLNSEKMQFDQRVLLRNLNEYMLRSSSWYQYWNILNLQFWETEVVDKELKLHALPITLTVNFDQKDWVINFLNNIENKVYEEIPVMYVIEQMSYNIPKYKEWQEIRFSLIAYYFEWLTAWEDVLSDK